MIRNILGSWWHTALEKHPEVVEHAEREMQSGSRRRYWTWGGASGKEPTSQCRRCKRYGFDPWVGKIPWRRTWQPAPVFLPGESHGQRSLGSYSPWNHKESDTTERQHACTLHLREASLNTDRLAVKKWSWVPSREWIMGLCGEKWAQGRFIILHFHSASRLHRVSEVQIYSGLKFYILGHYLK